MKTSVTRAWSSIVATIAVILLITGVIGCASSQPKPVVKPPALATEPVTVAEAVSPTKSRTEAQTRSTTSPESQQAAQKRSAIRVRKSHPRKYTVTKGDTLWDIASMFLKDPWYWPEIWHKNQQVKNPHLIYPGDILTLIYINGQPQILVNQQPTQETEATASTAEKLGLPVVKLSPSVRRHSLEASIPTIPGDAIRQFTTRPRVVTKKELESAPYIIGSDDRHLILGAGNRIYIRGELDKERVRFTVFRPGKELYDPDSKKVLGYEAIYAGEAHIDRYGDPAMGTLTKTEREVLIGDRLLPLDKSKINNLYFPHIPERNIKGRIISLFDALFGIAKFQIAVINKGNRDGIEVGHLLATQTRGAYVRDRYDPKNKGIIKMPDERSGLMMIFRSFDQVSYGLIMESARVIRNHDIVATPR